MAHPGWLIRHANVADAGAIARVHVDTWRSSYRGIVPDGVLDGLSYDDREDRWRKILSDGRSSSFTLVAEDDGGDVVGFAGGGPNRSDISEYTGELYAIYIRPACQRQGLGRRLAAAVARELVERGVRSMIVWVLSDSPYRRFYESLGGSLLDQQALYSGKGVELPEAAYGWADLGVLVGPPDPVLDLFGQVPYDPSYDYKAERQRGGV